MKVPFLDLKWINLKDYTKINQDIYDVVNAS